MERDERIKLAVQLAAPLVPAFGTPHNVNAIAEAIRAAYEAIQLFEGSVNDDGGLNKTTFQKA